MAEKSVIVLNSKQCVEWLTKTHYLKRMPAIMYAYGYVVDGNLKGVCTFSNTIARFNTSVKIYELSRLVIYENSEKNELSWFLSRALRLFPHPAIIVSYADSNWGHNGYIYQATNWIYTGVSSSEKRIWVNGEEVHRRTLNVRYGTSSLDKLKDMGYNIEYENQIGKHRYFFTVGNKRERKKLMGELSKKYKTYPYPKGENSRYDITFEPEKEIYINNFW